MRAARSVIGGHLRVTSVCNVAAVTSPHTPTSNEAPPDDGRLGRLGRFCARHHWWIIGAWVIALIAIGLTGQSLGGQADDTVSLPGVRSAEGLSIIQEAYPGQGASQGIVVVYSPTIPVTSPSAKAAIALGSVRLKKVPGVLSVTGPQISPDQHIAQFVVQWSTPPQDLGTANLDALQDASAPLRAAGLTVEFGGSPAMQAEADAPDYSVLVGVLAAMIILLLAFGSVITMLIPVVGSLIAVAMTATILIVLESFASISSVGLAIATMIGLGVSVDYGLFVLTRHDQQMAAGMPVERSVGLAVATAGRAVIIAGGTVAIGVLGLAIAQVPLVTRMGLCAALSVLVAVVAALTLLPAALGLVGTRLSGWRIPKITRPGPVQLEGADGKPHGWARWSLMVTRRPWPFLGGALAILIVLAIPLFSIDLGMVDSGSDPKSSTTYKAYGLVSKGFGPGSNGPIEVVLSGPNAQASAAAVAAAAKKVPDVAGTIGPIPSPTHPVSLITVVPQSAPASQATETLITQLESALQPVAGAGTQVYVTGTTAVGAELAAKVAARLPWFIGVVILISFILLMIEFRSLLVPLQAAIMNLLSVGAAFGVVVFVFQEGHGLSLIGVDQPVSIESWVPLMMFAILFGLSMDYEVFLLSRIREGWMATGDPHKSVALGLAGTARVISAAALVMVCVFLAFVLEPNVVVKMLGVGLATAVLVDATVVRLMLVPAVMILVGKGNWWLPKWLDRILPTLKEPGQG